MRSELVNASTLILLVGWTAVLAAPAFADDAPAAKELPPASTRPVNFVKDIQPLLARCTNCHGIEMQEAGLNLQVKKAALAGGDNGKVIVPGKSKESRLVVAVSRMDPELMMPPEGEGPPLTAEQLGLVRAWIDQGAKWPDAASLNGGEYWAYQKPARPEPPLVTDEAEK